ncbi:MAG: hypothetical protein J6I62_01015 [Selenomonadaceae bacterium]|nr:hypothetical protein [Selenomonadaceae bacterium]
MTPILFFIFKTNHGNAAQDAPREAFAAGRGKASNGKFKHVQNSSMATMKNSIFEGQGVASPLACFLWFVSFARAKEMNTTKRKIFAKILQQPTL